MLPAYHPPKLVATGTPGYTGHMAKKPTPHIVDRLKPSDSPAFQEWRNDTRTLLLRGLGSSEATKVLGLDLLVEEAARQPIVPGANALVALLAAQVRGFVHEPWKREEPRKTAKKEIHDAAIKLVELGYSPVEALPQLGGADALDYALAANMPEFVEAYAHLDPLFAMRRCNGKPWLHLAAEGGMIEMIRVLGRLGIDPNARDEEGATALFRVGKKDIMLELLGIGVDPSLLNHEKLDAKAHISLKGYGGDRAATNAIIAPLRSVAKNLDEKTRIAQFYKIALDLPGGTVRKEADALNIPGDVRFEDGSSLVGQAAARLRKAIVNKHNGTKMQFATSWLTRCTEWKEAFASASIEDLADAAIIVQGRSALEETIMDALALRLPDASQKNEALADAACRLVKDLKAVGEKNEREKHSHRFNNWSLSTNLDKESYMRLLALVGAHSPDRAQDEAVPVLLKIFRAKAMFSAFDVPALEGLSRVHEHCPIWQDTATLDYLVDAVAYLDRNDPISSSEHHDQKIDFLLQSISHCLRKGQRYSKDNEEQIQSCDGALAMRLTNMQWAAIEREQAPQAQGEHRRWRL